MPQEEESSVDEMQRYFVSQKRPHGDAIHKRVRRPSTRMKEATEHTYPSPEKTTRRTTKFAGKKQSAYDVHGVEYAPLDLSLSCEQNAAQIIERSNRTDENEFKVAYWIFRSTIQRCACQGDMGKMQRLMDVCRSLFIQTKIESVHAVWRAMKHSSHAMVAIECFLRIFSHATVVKGKACRTDREIANAVISLTSSEDEPAMLAVCRSIGGAFARVVATGLENRMDERLLSLQHLSNNVIDFDADGDDIFGELDFPFLCSSECDTADGAVLLYCHERIED